MSAEVAQVVAAVLDIPVEPTMGESFLGGILVNAFLSSTSCLAGGHNGGVKTPDSMLFYLLRLQQFTHPEFRDIHFPRMMDKSTFFPNSTFTLFFIQISNICFEKIRFPKNKSDCYNHFRWKI